MGVNKLYDVIESKKNDLKSVKTKENLTKYLYNESYCSGSSLPHYNCGSYTNFTCGAGTLFRRGCGYGYDYRSNCGGSANCGGGC